MGSVVLKNLSKNFGSMSVLQGVDLEIAAGEFVVFVGPSGCGKSTLLRIISGLEPKSSGEIEIDGASVSRLEPVERGIAMVFQNYALYPHMTVFENIAFPLSIQKQSKENIRREVERVATTLHLADRLNHKPGQLSGGQRQRVAIGRALVREPKVFLFDEPLSNLDASLRGAMRIELSELHQSLKATMIYVTHDQVEAMTMADRIVVLNHGKVEQFGSPMDLYKYPKTRFVAGFIGQPGMNFVSAEVLETTQGFLEARSQGGEKFRAHVNGSNVHKGQKVEVGIRPEHLNLDAGDAQLELRLRVVERLGGVTLLHGNLGDGTRICASIEGVVENEPGQSVRLYYDSTSLHVFDDDGVAVPQSSNKEYNQ